MANKRIGIYPGSFDPITNGHLDIISRAAKIVDQLIVAVALNSAKNPMFSSQQRVRMVTDDVAGIQDKNITIKVVAFDGLLVNFATKMHASLIIRGLRAVSDFEYEFQMTGINAKLNCDVETAFLMASDRNHFISSRFVKEAGAFGGDISHFVSPNVAKILIKHFANKH